MRTPRPLLFAAAVLAVVAARAADSSPLAWPEITKENKPWTRWWWPGSGVDKASLTAQLEKFAAAGIGGVEITPIYGAKGYEDRYIDFLSPKWMEMLEHVGREGQRLGIGIDMATGTGWPFGGPWIDEANANTKAVLKDGQIVGAPTKQMVKRAAPGDEGLVVDPYSPDALRKYLAPFDTAFAKFPRGLVRGQFHDSFEYYGATWTAKFAETFQAMHGYDVQRYAADLLGKSALDRDMLARIKCDYRDVLAKLHLDYLHTWVEWSHAHGFLVRNQSHGAPGNLLDLYANADIAETEVFGSTPFPIPGLRRNPDEIRTGNEQDLPEALVIRFASSAGHVVGHNLSSSETFTWLREHFKVSPSYMKPEVDRLFANGINHIFYHGTVFSPSDAPWPGWLFYASTQFNPNNPLWDDLAQVNRYIARVQSVLQRGKPDNDILLYWPIEDIWDHADGLMQQLAVHNVKWLFEQPFGKLAQQLESRGYGFDYISDEQLLKTKRADGVNWDTGGGTYPSYTRFIVPKTRRMPLATFEHLLSLAAESRATVIFVDSLPEDVPGYGHLEERRARFQAARTKLQFQKSNTDGISSAKIGEGLVVVCPYQHIERYLRGRNDSIADSGLSIIRRRSENDDGLVYFVANLTDKSFDGWGRLRHPPYGITPQTIALFDPVTGQSGIARSRVDLDDDTTSVLLQLQPGQSIIVRVYETRKASGPAWPYRETAGAPVTINGDWRIEFAKGGPELPPVIETKELKSWTDLGGDEAKRFAGTARYRVEFDAPAAKADDWLLDLGDVRETARVRLNGRDVATAWSLPFRLRVGEFLKPGKNVLELDVTNLAANRIRDLDQKKVNWKIMREINFVNINYKNFDASGWALTPSGLLGPVTLTPLKAVTP